MRAGEGDRRAAVAAFLRTAAERTPGMSRFLNGFFRAKTCGVTFVEPGGQLLRQAARVGEHDSSAPRQHQLKDALFDMRPERSRRAARFRRAAGVRASRYIGHILDRNGDAHRQRARGGRIDDQRILYPAEELRDARDRLHRGGKADALRRLRQQRIESFQADRQLRAAFAARYRVHLIQDQGGDAAQRLAGARGQHQKQRFRRRDQDIGRRALQLRPFAAGGIA